MLSLAASEKSKVFPVRKRRRLGAWLLVGWLAYWFATAAQACCISLPAGPGSGSRTPAFQTGELAAHSFGTPASPSLPDIDCEALGAIGPGVTKAAAAGIDRIDVLDAAPIASERIRTNNHARVVIAPAPLHPPAPGAPLYLRNQRLLI